MKKIIGRLHGRAGKIAYSLGNLGTSLLWIAFSVTVIFFYSDVVRLDPTLVGSAYAIYGIWNAINDPLMGYVSDRTKTRWGRRIPYILFGAFPLFFSFTLIWWPPTGGKPLSNGYNITVFFYFLLIISLFDFFYTAVSVAYISLFPEMFQDVSERADVQMYRQFFAAIGALLGAATPLLLVSYFSQRFGLIGGWVMMGITLGSIGSVPYYISLLGSKEPEIFQTDNSISFVDALRYTLKNKSFVTAIVTLLMIDYVWGLLPAMLPFYVKYVLIIDPAQTSFLLLSYFIASMLFLPLWKHLCVKLGTKRALFISLFLVAIFLQILFISDILIAFLTLFLIGSTNAGVLVTREIILSDIIDEDELKTGLRREGMYFGMSAFFMRFSLVMTGVTTAFILSNFGYVPDLIPQPPLAVYGIKLSITLIPLIALFVGLLFLKAYPLSKETVEVIKMKLRNKKS